MRLQCQIVRSHQVAIFCGLVTLRYVVVDLGHDGLLVGRELALGDVAQVGVGALQELAGGRGAVDGLVMRNDGRDLPGASVGIRVAFRCVRL